MLDSGDAPSQPRLVPQPKTLTKREKPSPPQTIRGVQREWIQKAGIGYQLRVPDLHIQFDLTRIHTSKDDISGLLTVRTRIAGARTVADDILSSADFNISSLRARQDRAKHLNERARVEEIDWLGLLEELCLRVLTQEETGQPEIALCDIQIDTEQTTEFIAAGMPLLRRHPTIWFGDGSAGKSLLALYAGIDIAQQGQRVLYCDWEFAGEEHEARRRQLMGQGQALRDSLFYRRCDRPFIREIQQIREVISRRKITFLICDSIGFAADGPPEAAEAATGYFRALRECGPLGSLHLAHMNRSEQGDQKPFGSVFWHAGARATWYLKRTVQTPEPMIVGMFHRKSNIGSLRSPLGKRFDFYPYETRISDTEVRNIPEFTDKLGFTDKILAALEANGSMTVGDLAEELGMKPNTVIQTVGRKPELFDKGAALGKQRLISLRNS